MKEWLSSIQMDAYFNVLFENGWHSLNMMKEIKDKRELKAAGIHKVADQCKLMAEIRKLTVKHNNDDIARQVNILFVSVFKL